MERRIGTVSRGVRCPIIREGDDLAKIVVDSVVEAGEYEGFGFNDKDVVAITESVVARNQGNYASVDAVAKDIKNKFGEETIGVIFPILSRNRFAICLKGIARGMDKITLLTSFPADEVGNGILDEQVLDESEYNLGSVITEEEYNETFGSWKHPFTGINMIDFYRELIEAEDCEVEFVFSNDIKTILDYNNDILACDIHTREKTIKILKAEGATVYGLHHVLAEPIGDSGFNPDYGVLGSNKATEETIKLFPNDCTDFVNKIQANIKEATGKTIEVMVYGDGAFKDPVGKIWELADPTTTLGATAGLAGTPKEVKLKYLASANEGKTAEEIEAIVAAESANRKKTEDVTGEASLGTTPRQITDLLASLADLTTGSGDRQTPVVLIKNYL